MTPFVDSALARRLERAEGTIGASCAENRAALDPASGSTWGDVDGAMCTFDSRSSQVTQAFAFGMSGPVDVAAIERVEAFFASRGAETHLEICPLAGVAVTALLVARGYLPIEMSSVLVRALDAPLPASERPLPPVRRAVPADEAAWVEAAARGWAEGTEAFEMVRGFARVSFSARAMTPALVELDGAIVATGCFGAYEGIALLAGASTVPSARNRGAQNALLAWRLAEARARGCEVAMMATEPGSVSQKNAERNGFRVAYTRTKWRKPIAGSS